MKKGHLNDNYNLALLSIVGKQQILDIREVKDEIDYNDNIFFKARFEIFSGLLNQTKKERNLK